MALLGRCEDEVLFSLTEGDELRDVLLSVWCNDDPDRDPGSRTALLLLSE